MLFVTKRFACLLALAALVVTAGCDSNDDDGGGPPPPGMPQTFSGTLAGSSMSGALTLTIEDTSVTGTLTLISARGGFMPPLAGNYNANTGAITFSGGGFSFTGTISGGVLSGTWTGPDGSSGTFSAYLHGSSDGDEVRVYCGTYDTAQDDGTLNIVRRGTDLLGMAVEYGEDNATGLRGRVNGRNITVWLMNDGSQTPVATGVFSEDFSTASGSIAASDGNTGTWSVGLCGG